MRDQRPDEDALARIRQRLAHRGPDGHGSWCSKRLALLHTRLSIIDLVTGQQPLYSTDGNLVLVANGEIYNYVELGERLKSLGHRFVTRSDNEVILNAYAEYGEDLVQHLHGMFAFALFDRRQDKLLLVRDRLGIKPLFYSCQPDRLVFGSEIKALLPAITKLPEVNPRALACYFMNQFSPGQETIFQGIHRLLPGQMMSVDRQLRCSVTTYWTPLQVASRKVSLPQAEAEFASLFNQVMTEHVRSDVPYGLFLSGGVDSAILLAMLSRHQNQPVRTFSIGFQDVRMSDELDDATRIAKYFRTIHTPLRLDRQAVFSRLPNTIWMADELMRDYACLPTSALAEFAARELKVVFSGEGGDEVFAGYRRYRNSPENYFKSLLTPGSAGFKTRGQLQKRWPDRLFSGALRPVWREFRQPVLDAWSRTPASWSRIQKCQYVDMTTSLPDNLLVKTDRMLMGFGLEGRVPFLDHRVVEFGLSLPDELKIASKQGKVFLKQWADDFFPKNYLHKPKRGFHVPVGEWLAGPLVSNLADKLSLNRAVRDWLNQDAIINLCRQQQAKQNVTRELWSVMQFAIWYKMFVENEASFPSANEDPIDWI